MKNNLEKELTTHTIRITTTRHYTKTAVVEIPYPEVNGGSLVLDEIADYLLNNPHIYDEEMDHALLCAEEDEYVRDETRYDVIEKVVLNKKVFGGTL